MGRRLFGDRFDFTSSLSPNAAKARIHARRKPIFHPKSGARGWIAGPVICLWWSPYDPRGPILFGRIRRNGTGARISGRAGSDLNGIAAAVLISFGVFPFIGASIYSESDSLTPALLLCALLAAPLMLAIWMRRSLHREAEPLVKFLQTAVENQPDVKQRKKARPAPVRISGGLTLNVNGVVQKGVLSADTISDALGRLEYDDFAIISATEECYLQTAYTSTGWVVEKRDGDSRTHLYAVRDDGSETFEFDEMLDAFLAYASQAPEPAGMTWHRKWGSG